MNTKSIFAATLFAGALLAGNASAQVKALILSGNGEATGQAVFNDIVAGDARFDQANSAVAAHTSGHPTLAYLQQFDAVLAWTDSGFNFAGLSDLLGDYVAAGGGVVLGTFWGQQVDVGNNNGINALLPLTNPRFDAYSPNTLGAYNAADPLMQGVTTLSATTYNADYGVGLAPGATLAASWASGAPLAAYNANRNVAIVTLFPTVATFGHASGDYDTLFANALVLVGTDAVAPPGVPEPTTWALMILGFGGAGAMVRRRRSGSASGIPSRA